MLINAICHGCTKQYDNILSSCHYDCQVCYFELMTIFPSGNKAQPTAQSSAVSLQNLAL